MSSKNIIRLATEKDAAGILEIYRPFIERTAASFEKEAPDESEMAARVSKYLEKHCWLVYEFDGKIGGYAYSSPHRAREAYQWTIETSIYIADEFHGKGIGKKMYQILLDISKKQGYFTALAGITMPNPASVRLHEKFGFKQIAFYENVGYKFGKWHDTIWLTLRLQEEDMPKKLQTVSALDLSDVFG